MSDKEARVLGAGKTVEVGGREYTLSPITMARLQELQREAVSFYKRQVLTTFTENMDILGDLGPQMLQQQIMEAARWDVDDLPKKITHDVTTIDINDNVKARIVDEFQLDEQETAEWDDTRWKQLLASMLDQDKIKAEEVKELAGKRPLVIKISYDSWWVTGTFEGMASMVKMSLVKHHPEVTTKEITEWPMADLAAIARDIEDITAPALGNT